MSFVLCLSIWGVYSLGYIAYKFSNVPAAIFAVVAFVGLYPLLKGQLNKRVSFVGDRALWGLSGFFVLLLLTGFYLDHSLPFEEMTILEFLTFILCVAGLTPPFKCLFANLYLWIERFAEREGLPDREFSWRWATLTWLYAFLVIFICWIPVWLAYFPGLWNYDIGQVRQYLSGRYVKKHPLLHTLLLGACYAAGGESANHNANVALYDFIQMAIMAGIFAFSYVYIARRLHSRVFRGGVLLFFALFPANSIMAISPTKDILFSGLCLLCLVLAASDMEAIADGAKPGWPRLLFLALCVVLMLSFRNNAIHAFYLFVLLSLIFIFLNRLDKRVALFIVLCLALFKLSDWGLTTALSARPGPFQEMMCLPSQQFGRIYNRISDEDDKRLIRNYYQLKQGERNYPYAPWNGDEMRKRLKLKSLAWDDFAPYLRASFGLFVKYPLISIDSLLYTTKGNWYINDIFHAYVYTAAKEDSDAARITNVAHRRVAYLQTFMYGGYGIRHESKLPVLEAFMERITSWCEHQKWPLFSIFFAPAFYFWILVFCSVGFWGTRHWHYLFLSGYLWCNLATLMAAACVLVRFTYPLFVCAPVLLCMLVRAVQGTLPQRS